MDRREVSFPSGGASCAAWLYSAQNGAEGADRGDGPRPHRDAARRPRRLRRALRRSRLPRRSSSTTAGSATAAASRTCFEPARQLEDWRAAIAFARSLPGVDPDRVATFGSSMGGGNALAAAAGDARVAAAISQVPFLDLRPPGAPLIPARSPRGCCGPPRRGAHLPAVGQPDEAAFINAPGSEAGWRHVVAIGEDSRWRNRVSARWLLGRRTARSVTRRRCTARGWSASERPIRSRSRAPRSRRRDARRTASCASTRASITSTSTTAPSTRPSSPTRSTS